MRSGTLPAPLCVGFGAAAALAVEEMEAEAERLADLRSLFLETLDAADANYVIHGDMDHRIPGNLNIAFEAAPALDLMNATPNVAVATGSACSSASVEPSYVLRALGVPDAEAARSLRIGFGRQTTEFEAVTAAKRLAAAAAEIARAAEAAE